MSDSEEWEDAITAFSDDEFKDAEDDNLEYYSKRNPQIVKNSLFTLPEYEDESESDNENFHENRKQNNNNSNDISHTNSTATINNSVNDINDCVTDKNNDKEHLSVHKQPPIDLRKEQFNIKNIMEESLKQTDSQETLNEEESKEEKEIKQLEEEIDKILSCSPEEIEGLVKEAKRHKELGNQYFKDKEYKNALEEYKKAVDICPHSKKEDLAIYYNNMAACYVYIGTNEQVASYCTRAIDCNPNYVKALVRRAYANEKIGKSYAISQAINDHKKVLELDPDNNNSSRKALSRLEVMLKVQQEKEKEEMLGKFC